MIIPYKEIRDVLGEPLRDNHIVVALRMYCVERAMTMKDVDFRKFSEWAKAGLSKTRAGCSGKVGYESRKLAKQKLKKRERIDGDGVYECSHCGRWHITSKLLSNKEPAYCYRLYGNRLD